MTLRVEADDSSDLSNGRASSSDPPRSLPAISIETGPSLPNGVVRHREPLTFGLPFPRGMVTSIDHLSIVRWGTRAVLQTRVLERWTDGSVRWLLADVQADVPGGKAIYQLESGATGHRLVGEPVASVSHHGSSITIDTGVASFNVGPGTQVLFEHVGPSGANVTDAVKSCLSGISADGHRLEAAIDRVSVEESGRVRTTVLSTGRIAHAEQTTLELFARLHFFAGSSTVRCDLTVRNPRRAEHRSGLWDLGDPASVLLKDLSLTFTLAGGGDTSETRWAAERDAPFECCNGDFELYQDSSGGENWQSSNHLNRHHQIPTSFRGYRVRAGGLERTGNRAVPTVTLARDARQITLAVPYFWQNFPKAIDVRGDTLALRLFPGQYADLHEIQGGEQKTHTFFVAFGPDHVTERPLAWCLSPSIARADSDWYCSTGALPYVLPASTHPSAEHLALLDAAVDGADTFEHKREVIDQYGWRHFGDIYGDHETVYAEKRNVPLVSHYNNQYDPVAGFAYRFVATGDRRWHDAMNELAVHVVDVDIYHTTEDKAAYNRGLFWHTYHYVDADTATHRSYPSASKAIVKGGGPSSEQNYATGLMLHYFLTGNEESRRTAIDLARFVVDIDDGRKTVFRWLDRGPTGLATASGSLTYHGPGRASGNSLSVLLDGHRLTGDRSFLDKAESVIRRCIHPADGIAARDLLDVERKWFYTMFLQALGKYLDYKVELGELDAMYAYARASLLHYSRWMAANEQPYLDRPEVLQYPTETWAAQDIRKSDVFAFAAMHSSGQERETFLERAAFFFRYSVTTLRQMPTRTFARPVVVLLTSGLLYPCLQRTLGVQAPPPAVVDVDFGVPETFVPQRIRATQRFRRLVGLAAGALAVLAVWLAIRWL